MKNQIFGQCALILCFTAFGLSGCQQSESVNSPVNSPVNSTAQSAIQQEAVEIYLVRHAEKTTERSDPALSVDGQARAALLADMLKDAGITHIHSSDYTRTRDTAAPVAKRLGLTVELYDPRDLTAVAAKLKAQGGRHLVVGHSNTTPELTALLGGDSGTPIVEATEYDRLYYVTIGKDAAVTSTLLRFGK